MTTPTATLDLRYRTAAPAPARPFNVSSISSAVFVILFVSYFIVPHGGFLHPIMRLGMLFLVIVPLCALICSSIAIKQITETKERGAVISYVTLAVSSLYFITALAIPFVIVGMYILYAYVI